MKYSIEWMEKKTTASGKNVISATLKTDRGSTFDKVSIWGDFPGWASLSPGQSVEGEIKTNDKGYKSLYEDKAPAPTRPASGAVSAAKITSESVEKAQNRKNDSIAYFNSLNSAISFVSQFKDPIAVMDAGDYYLLVLNYRDKFLDEWRKYDAGDITDKSRPF